ncbi:hypothetical protein ASD65_06990 [Microbacterium sp. Root61]|uniref:transglutaminase family protein n=1 Tax=Microbacterium sp. Root61 TaxID=1736570 RepID=UPI0006F7943A|nr:DUF3488 and transglutaminase-like domain-containing protein [Microbacterium sp. Root61]KRA24194.1 hypothetical protein ASD65_06990 [Microbacterium sp. Root61]
MPSSEAPLRRGGELALTIGVFVAVFAAMMPLLRVIETGWWVLGAVVLSAAVLAAGFVARRFRLPAVAVSLIEAAVWVVLLTVMFLRDSALLGLIPTPDTVRTVPGLIGAGIDEVVLGAAPLEAGTPLSFFIVGAMGILTIVIDHVVLTARMPLLASVGLIAISLIPSIAVPGEIDVTSFVLLAASILFLLRVETRARETAGDTSTPSTRTAPAGGVSATALGIGAIGVIVAIVATPLLPPLAEAGSGVGVGAAIDPTLQLGDDLRRPAEVEVLTVRTSAQAPPYLRAATLSAFDGSVWQPDRSRTLPLDSPSGLGPITADEEIRVVQETTTVQVQDLDSPWLPVAFPAISVTGLDGEWSAVPYNRTVVSRDGSAQGQSYDVTTELPRPTLEQIRARTAGGPELRDETTALPADLPPIIGELAAQITADKTNDYDRLVALQTWFRGSEFQYSLEAPVEEGFDGTGADAVARFLEVRAGYCVHFASAFALMARTLGMPARIVVGYLPGSNTNTTIDGKTVYAVSSSQLHAWPEVYFGGIGWVPFEPTNSLGVPTTFSAGSTTPGGADPQQSAAPLPRESASSSASPSPSAGGLRPGDSQAGRAEDALDPTPVLVTLFGILVALAIPGLIRELRRRQLLAAARGGDAAAAWTSVQDVAIDLGIDVPGSESARALGTRLVQAHGAPADEMSLLIGGIERASYAAGGRHGFWQGAEMADAATAVRAGMLAAVDRSRRILALAAPRSLIVRPGSVYAGSGRGSQAR